MEDDPKTFIKTEIVVSSLSLETTRIQRVCHFSEKTPFHSPSGGSAH